MSLSSLHLDAFTSVAKEKSFSKAAKSLNITQSALSQRILNLEENLGSTLFVREPSGVRLTDLGFQLLRYCQSKESLENEFMQNFKAKGDASGLAGTLKIGAFSSISCSILVPLITELIRPLPSINLELKTEELYRLPDLLITGVCDFIFLSQPLERRGIESHLLGYEEYLLVQSAQLESEAHHFLDHDAQDSTTLRFLIAHGKKTASIRRHYLSDIQGVIEAAKGGLGAAVVPSHLIKGCKDLKIVPRFKRIKSPVYLSYYSQSFYTALQSSFISHVERNFAKYLQDGFR